MKDRAQDKRNQLKEKAEQLNASQRKGRNLLSLLPEKDLLAREGRQINVERLSQTTKGTSKGR